MLIALQTFSIRIKLHFSKMRFCSFKYFWAECGFWWKKWSGKGIDFLCHRAVSSGGVIETEMEYDIPVSFETRVSVLVIRSQSEPFTFYLRDQHVCSCSCLTRYNNEHVLKITRAPNFHIHISHNREMRL